MNLVIQGTQASSSLIDRIARVTRAERVDQRKPTVWCLTNAQSSDDLELLCQQGQLDHAWIEAGRKLSDFRLFVTDMDSTLINIECIDEVADMQGLKREVSGITEAAMRGELDFTESLKRRVSLLKGLPERALDKVFAERLELNPGAEKLMKALKAHDIHTVLVSGGFTFFTDRLKQQLGFDAAYANVLEVKDGLLTGKVCGPVVDAEAKLAHLNLARQQLACRPDQVIAVGDGANDLPMIRAAGFGVAWRAKPILQTAANCCLNHVGLDGIADFFA